MLGRLALGCFHGLSHFRCRRSFGLRSIHLAPNCSPTETTLKNQEKLPVTPRAVDPSWVMLNTYLWRKNSIADAKTVAESCTSTERRFCVYTDLAAPPASSFLCYDWQGGSTSGEYPKQVIASHGDSVLFEFMRKINFDFMQDYFVYRGGNAARLPSLSLLPTHDFSKILEGETSHRPRHPREQRLFQETTGLLRRSDDELLVVELDVWNERVGVLRDTAMADLNVIRIGSSEWEINRDVPIIISNGSRGEMRMKGLWSPEKVVPVGNRFLCWVKYSRGILVCDMADTNLIIRHLPLPVMPREGRRNDGSYSDDAYDDCQMKHCRNMCEAGADALRFVSIDPRCCCGGPGRGACTRSAFAFTVTTWTMSLGTGEETMWVKDSVLDCEELWALPGYEGLPHVPPDCPVLISDNPDIVCFKVSNRRLVGSSYDQLKVWLLEVDTRRKVILSVFQCPNDPYDHLPAKFVY